MAAAVKAAKTLGAGKRCVVILPDSTRNYMTKFLSDEWMIENGFAEEVGSYLRTARCKESGRVMSFCHLNMAVNYSWVVMFTETDGTPTSSDVVGNQEGGLVVETVNTRASPMGSVGTLMVWSVIYQVRDLDLQTPMTISPGVTCREAVELLSKQGFDTLPVISDAGVIHGVVTEGNLTANLVHLRVAPEDDVTKALYTQFRKVSLLLQRWWQ